MNEKIKDWITRLGAAEKKDRKAIVEDMAKALGLKIGEAYKALKEAGWDIKTAAAPPPLTPPAGPDPPEEESATPEEKGITDYRVPVTLRHTSPHPHYRRAGLLLTKTAKQYEVTREQLAALVNDPWVEVKGR